MNCTVLTKNLSGLCKISMYIKTRFIRECSTFRTVNVYKIDGKTGEVVRSFDAMPVECLFPLLAISKNDDRMSIPETVREPESPSPVPEAESPPPDNEESKHSIFVTNGANVEAPAPAPAPAPVPPLPPAMVRSQTVDLPSSSNPAPENENPPVAGKIPLGRFISLRPPTRPPSENNQQHPNLRESLSHDIGSRGRARGEDKYDILATQPGLTRTLSKLEGKLSTFIGQLETEAATEALENAGMIIQAS